MTILEHWQQQKEGLNLKLGAVKTMADAVYQVRHAILQTEQNALAEMSDDILRQQASVLFGSVKNAAGLLEASKAHASSPAAKPARQKMDRSQLMLTLISAFLLVVLAVCCYFKGWLLGTVLSLCALLMGAASFLCKSAPAVSDSTCIQLPDLDRLLVLLDGQMRLIDRSLNDFSYLNDQLSCGVESADEAALSRAADLMEALMECDEEEREPAEEAANRLLGALGFCAVMYSEESSKLFNILPSKNTTCTLSPAILSAQDHRLLRRGTAAVRTDAA